MMEQELPEGWEKTTFGVIGEVVTGNTPSRTFPEYFNGCIPWVKPGDINKAVEIIDTEESLTELGASKARLLPAGSIMVTCIGNLGNVAIAGVELATNQQINSVIINHPYVDKKYVYYCALTLKPWLSNNSTSTTISMVNKSNFEKAPLYLPPLAEQIRIVAKLDAAFAHLETLKTSLARIPELLKKFRQTVLTQAVTGRLTEDWREEKTLDESFYEKLESLHRAKNNALRYREKEGFIDNLQLFEIPEAWRWVSNFKLASDGSNAICAGPFGTIFKAKDFRTEGVPIIFLRHVKPGRFVWKTPNYMDEKVWKNLHQPYSVYGGELLVTKLGDPPGDAAIYPNDFGVSMVTPDVMKMSVDNRVVITEYLMYFFNSDVSKEILSKISFGATRLRIDLTMFKAFQIPLPSLKEQQEIVSRVEALFAQADALEAQYVSLKEKIDKLPQALLAKAFRGELVPQDPDDEPAEVLLERIKAAAAKSERRSGRQKKAGQTELAFIDG